MKNILYFTLFIFSLISCKKKEEDKEPVIPTPTITVISPAVSSTYQKDDTIFIKANIVDEQGIHEVIVNIIDLSTTSTIFHLHNTFLTSPYAIDTFYVVTTSSTNISYRIEIFERDHSTNTTQENILVNIVP